MRQLLTSLAELVGAVMVTVGAFQIAEPFGFIVGGSLAITGGALAARQ